MARFAITSEVATLEFLRTVLKIPVPEVYGWKSDSSESNPVGAEYMLIENVSGVELEQVWPEMTESDRFSLVQSVVRMEAKLASTIFSSYGSLYFADDGTNNDMGDRYSVLSDEMILGDSEDKCSQKFVIGKCIERGFCAEGCSELDIDQGPWKSIEDYFTAIAKREIAWISTQSKPTQGVDFSHIGLLEKFLLVLPYITPKLKGIISPTLWHTDLHRGNIFVDPSQTSQITGIIDWQGVWVAPFFRQARFASAFECDWNYPWGAVMPPPLRPDINLLSEDERRDAHTEYDEVRLKKFYEVASRKLNPPLFRALDAIKLDDDHLILSVFNLVRRSIDGPIPLRHVLTLITANWDSFAGGKGIPCPIAFSPEEIVRSSQETEKWAEAYSAFHTLRSRLVGKDGWVSHDEYGPAKAQLEKCGGELRPLQDRLIAAGGTDVDNVV